MSEIEPWTRQILSVTVSQICKTIGWHSISSTCLHVLVDILHRYLKRMASTIHDYAEHDNRTFPALEEIFLAFNEMNVNVEELKEYIDYVAPIVFRHKVPKYPLEKKSNLNFLKPGSREVVTRPVHIHEHLPAMYPELSDENYPSQETLVGDDLSLPSLANGYINGASSSFKKSRDFETFDTKHDIEEVGRPLRELSCVTMTSFGFLSHGREARGPEARLPKTLPSVAVPVLPTLDIKPATPVESKSSSGEHKKHHKSHSSHSKSHDRHKQRDENNHNDSKVKKLVGMKELSKLKAFKPLATANKTENGPASPKLSSKHENRLKTPAIATNPISPKLPKPKKHADKLDKSPVMSPIVISLNDESYTVADEKLTTEPNKQKLTIFKRISKVKEDRAESPQPNKINTNDRNTQINDCIEAVVKQSREKDGRQRSPMPPMEPLYVEPVELGPISPPSFAENVSVPSGGSTGSVSKHTKRKKKQKLRDSSEPPSKKSKTSSDAPSEKPKSVEPEPPPFAFFTPGVISPSLSSNLLIPRFPVTFMNASMRHPNPNAPHPEMPNMPLPPPTMQAAAPSKPSSSSEQHYLHHHHPVTLKIGGSGAKEPVHETQHSMSDVAAAAAAVMDKKLKKKMKKDKREKDKKKREKKDRLKMKALKMKEKAEKKQKTKNKNKVKKKDKLAAVQPEAVLNDDRSSVPKLTLKLNSPQPSPNGMASPKITIKPIVKMDEMVPTHVDRYGDESRREERAPSPELAKIAFIGKPSKHQKHGSAKSSSESKSSSEKSSKKSEGKSKSSKEKSKSKKADAALKQRPPLWFYDDRGVQVWICPGCSGPDDGSPMIGCDGCDAWYHWTCVGIKYDPDIENWFCPLCRSD